MFLIQAESTSGQKAPVYAVTNGHCFGLPYFENTVSKDVTLDQEYRGEFNAGNSSQKKVQFKFSKVLYSSMYQTDIAILEIENSIETVKKAGLAPIAVSSRGIGQDFSKLKYFLPSIPILHVRGKEVRDIRVSQCHIGNIVQVKEAQFTYHKSIQHQCNSQHGSSGAPLVYLNVKSNKWELLGIHNTSPDSENPDNSCEANAPCEVHDDRRIVKSYNYAQDMRALRFCFDQSGKFDIDQHKCPLPLKGAYQGRLSGNNLIFKGSSGVQVVNDLISTVKRSVPLEIMGSKQPFSLEKNEIEFTPEYVWIKTFSKHIQEQIFGQELFPLFLSQENTISIILNKSFEKNANEHGYILVSKNFLDAIYREISDNDQRKLAIQLSLIHEISHYIYEWHLVTYSKNYRSLNGGISLDRTPEIKQAYEKLFQNLTFQDYQKLVNQSHTEVDWVALAVYKKFIRPLSWLDYKTSISTLYLIISKFRSFSPKAGNGINIRFETIKDSWGHQ